MLVLEGGGCKEALPPPLFPAPDGEQSDHANALPHLKSAFKVLMDTLFCA
jgi:hypothetical protein